MKGILIDCYREKGKIILWIKCDNRNLRLEDSFIPKIYVKSGDLRGLKQTLLKNSIKSRLAKKRSFFGGEMWVLEIQVHDISLYGKTTGLIERITDYNAEICNAGLQLEEYYFFEKDIFPLAKVEFEAEDGKITQIATKDDSDDIDYRLPEFKICKVAIKTRDNLFKGFSTKIEKIFFDNEILEGNEKEMLQNFKEKYEKADPDVLWTENGNMFLPFLKEKFSQHSISFRFNRFDDDDIKFKEGDFYDTYSRVIYRTSSIFLKGRLHFDTYSFFADDIGYYGILDVARACRIRIQRAEMRSAGACVTNLLLYVAHKLDYLLPYKTGIYERFKTLEQLYNCDRGSLIFEPRTGFHTDVIEFDFVSLYPNIMNKFNLSPETLFCRCCRHNKVPGLHYHYCQKVRGVVPIVAKKLIERRIELKRKGDNVSKQKVDYLKWCLVTLFGYQAFKNRKIGIIESHESIQAYAREILLNVVRIAELHGWEVIHGIIDSIYLKKEGFTDIEVQRLGKEIYHATGMELSYEGSYKWIVFLPSVLDDKIPVPSHYYGVFEGNELKCRGIEARRKDSAKIVADMQLEMIEALSKASNENEFRNLFSQVFRILRRYVKALPFATLDDITITKTLTKTDYRNNIAQKMVIQQLQQEGFDVKPGMKVSYVIKDISNKNPSKRYKSTDSFDGKFDVNKYTDMLVKATFSILQPFGLTIKEIYKKIGKCQQLTIGDFELKEKHLNIEINN